jgi:hypothetical protein
MALDAAKNLAWQIRPLSGGGGCSEGDLGIEEDAEIEFPSYGRTPSPECKRCIDVLVDLVRRCLTTL